MRVIAGRAKGRRLEAPPGRRIRPTGDRVRESLFGTIESMIGLDDASVADLCCGTGALGIEALSRGASRVVFVDADARSLRATRANLTATGFGEPGADAHPTIEVVRADVVAWARRLAPSSVGIALVDPPYAWSGWRDLLEALVGKVEVVVAESDREIDAPTAWSVARARRQGGTVITVFTADPDDRPE